MVSEARRRGERAPSSLPSQERGLAPAANTACVEGRHEGDAAMMRPVDEGLTTIDIDMAQQLQSYSKKITQLRKASGNDAPLSRPRRERRKRNRRTRQLRSEAEDYRRARLAQRVVWVICSVQVFSTVLMAVLSHPAFGVSLIGYGFGMAASFARVQRHHGVCMVFNVAYGLVSFGEPSALLAEIVQAGSPEGLMRKLPRPALALGLGLGLGLG